MQHVIIIGAGPAGLTAGYELAEKGYQVTILEKSGDIGGISKTVKHNGNRMDIGGHRFFSKDTQVMQWWQNMMPMQGAPSYDDEVLGRAVPLDPNGPDPKETDRVMLTRNRVSRIYYDHHFFDYPVSLKWATLKTMGFLTTMQVGFSYLATILHKLPNSSLENFYINSFGKKLYSMFFEGYTEKLWGRHPREIAADWGAQRTKELSIMGILKDMLSKIFLSKEQRAKMVQTSLIEEFRYPKFGPGQLWETVADEIVSMGGSVVMNSEVIGVLMQEDHITGVSVKDETGTHTLQGDAFISSMPVKDLIAGMPQAPSDVARVAKGLPYRDFVTVGLLVEKLNLKNETTLKTLSNILPDCWIYVQDASVKLGRIQIFNNWSPYLVSDPEKYVWVGLEYFCTEGDDFWNQSQEDCVQHAVKELVTMGVINDDTPIVDSHRERVQKAYPAYFDTYSEMSTVVDYLNTIDNLYCVGRNGQHRYNNMDHSMATSFVAVDCLSGGTSTKEALWNVNTEQSYHEEKDS